jgi:lipopolysaccharide heptosyltransferase II
MKKILVHNFTRLGDLLQSTPLLMGIKAQYPSCEIVMAVHKRFQEVCEGFPFVDVVISFDSDGLKETILQGSEGLLQSYRYVKSYTELLKQQHFDLVFNLSHSRASCFLLALLGIPHVRGSIVDRTAMLSTIHPWANYFKNMTINRATSAFNLVDVYRRMGDVPIGSQRLTYEVSLEAHASADGLLRRLGPQDGSLHEAPLLIGFQPGASQDSRQWPASAFAKLGKALCAELGARIVIFGTEKEAPLGEVIVQECEGQAVSVMGKTSVAQLAALLQRCKLLVTNDTGTMHLSCAVGTQVVALFMGPAVFHQTGPYGEGHVVLQAELACAPCNYLLHCSHQVCKEHLRWDAVLQTVKWVIQGTHHPPPKPVPGLGAYMTRFDADGYLSFAPLTKRTLDWNTLMRIGYREAWKVLLDGKALAEAIASVQQEIEQYYAPGGSSDGMDLVAEETCRHFDHLHSLAQRGTKLSQELVDEARRQPYDITQIRLLAKEIEAVDEQLRILGTTSIALKPITEMFRFGKENLQGWDLLPLAQQTRALYTDLSQQSVIASQVLAACIKARKRRLITSSLPTEEGCHTPKKSLSQTVILD